MPALFRRNTKGLFKYTTKVARAIKPNIKADLANCMALQ